MVVKVFAYLYMTRKYSSARAYLSSCSIGSSIPIALNAAFFHEVTIFQPKRPFVRWSRVEKRLARRKGGSNEVDAVIPNVRFLVTAAIADSGYIVYSVRVILALGSAISAKGTMPTYDARV